MTQGPKNKAWAHLLYVLFFVGVTGLMLFVAYGYQFAFDGSFFQKTSIIDVPFPPGNASVYLNDELQAEELPAQIKPVLPGEHVVRIEKENFRPWARSVLVEEDVVSIVRDVLLIPRDLSAYMRDVLLLEEGNEVLFFDSFALRYEPGGNGIDLLHIGSDDNVEERTLLEERLALFQDDFVIEQVFSEESFLFSFQDGASYVFLDFDAVVFQSFSLPTGAANVQYDAAMQRVYFVVGTNLYMAPISEDEQAVALNNASLLVEVVEDYILGDEGYVYFVSMGMFYVMNVDDKDVSLLDHSLGSMESVRRLEPLRRYHKNFKNIFLLGNADGTALLVAQDNLDQFRKIASDVIGEPIINNEVDHILLVTSQQELWFYDAAQNILRRLGAFPANAQLLGWFDTVGHYAVLHDNTVVIRSIFDDQESLILENITPENLFLYEQTFVWREGNKIRQLFWQEALAL